MSALRRSGPPSVVVLARLYVAYAVVAVPWLVFVVGGTFAVVAAVVTAVAGLGHLLGGARLRRHGELPPVWRRSWIAASAVLVPLQFGFSVASGWALVGTALSGAVVGALKPRFGRLRPTRRKLALTLHVGLSVGWLGVSSCMFALSAVGLGASDADSKRRTYEVMHLLDLAVVIPLVVLSVVSGLVVSLWGKFGLVKHWWVVVKLVVALAIPLGGGALSDSWISALADDPEGPTAVPLVVLMGVFLTGLWTATALSVYKPWGRTPWTDRRRARTGAAALEA